MGCNDKGVVRSDERGGMMKVFSGWSTIWIEGRRTGFLRESMQGTVLVVSQWVGRGRGRLMPWKTV